MPKNFILEYDIITDGGFTGRTGGAVELILTTNDLASNNDVGYMGSGKAATVTILTESGNEANYSSNYRGLLSVGIANNPDVNEENHSKGIKAEVPLTQFTNNRTKVHIAVSVQNGQVSVLANDKAIIQPADFKMVYGGPCKLCGVPAGLQFKNIRFNNLTNEGESIGVYISNIRITGN